MWAAVRTTDCSTRDPPHRKPPVLVSRSATIQGNSPNDVRDELLVLVIFGMNLVYSKVQYSVQ